MLFMKMIEATANKEMPLHMKKRLVIFTLTLAGLLGLIIFTAPFLIKNTKFGLEFKGGYEIQYVADAYRSDKPVTTETLLETIQALRKRADAIGMAEPEINIEGKDRIRLKIAGLTNV